VSNNLVRGLEFNRAPRRGAQVRALLCRVPWPVRGGGGLSPKPLLTRTAPLEARTAPLERKKNKQALTLPLQ
jgi:hypothetical protein